MGTAAPAMVQTEAQGDLSSAASHTEPVSRAVPASDRQIAACFGDAVALLELH